VHRKTPVKDHAEFAIAAVHPALPGHFPGQPVVPGVLLLAQVLEAALAKPEWAARLGTQPRLAVIKFLAPVTPGTGDAKLGVHFDDVGTRVRFEVRDAAHADRVAARGEWVAAVPPQAGTA
jgi:3-hydroxymyristoyl/3-hydroxydecanoyl-(acyl carrier protein) dehydratase